MAKDDETQSPEDVYNEGNAAAQKVLAEHAAVGAGLTAEEAEKLDEEGAVLPNPFQQPQTQAEKDAAAEEAASSE